MILFILSTFFWGCTGDDAVTDCSTITASKDKDLCFHDQVVSMNASQINEVITIAKKMDDAMIRGAAVAEWIKLYNNDINQQQGQKWSTSHLRATKPQIRSHPFVEARV